MKATLKRIISGLLVVAMAAGMFALAPVKETEAASMTYDKKVTVYLLDKSGKSSGYNYDGIGVENPSKSIKLSSLKSSRSSVATVTGVDNYGDYSYIEFKAKKPGTTTITFKVGSKKYTSKVTVKNYTNPAKTVKISGVSKGKNIASKTKKKTYAYNLKLSKTTKKAKLKVKAKSGWKLMDVFVYDNTKSTPKTVVEKFYDNGTTKQKTLSLGTLKKSHVYSVYFTFKNKKNGCYQSLDYDINW